MIDDFLMEMNVCCFCTSSLTHEPGKNLLNICSNMRLCLEGSCILDIAVGGVNPFLALGFWIHPTVVDGFQ